MTQRTTSFAAVVLALCVAVPLRSLAASPKPPKNLCLDWDTFTDSNVLFVKAVGAVKTAPGKVKFFSISGSAFNGSTFPVAGAGNLEGNVFHATWQGTANSVGQCSFEVLYDLTAGTGTINYHYDDDAGGVIEGTDTVTGVDCATLTIAGAPSTAPLAVDARSGRSSSGR
jgi:hypothetical protein